jgi:nucleoside-diphosphate-sugar epimerase
VPDVAAGLATLGTDDRAVGQVWHLPGPETVTTRRVLEIIAADVKHPVGVRSVPKLVLRGWGVISPTMRSVAEMTYQFEEPFVLDTTKYRSTFGGLSTSLDTAITETLGWYRHSWATAHRD